LAREKRETTRKLNKAWAEKMKLGKVETGEMKIRIDQGIFDHGWDQDGSEAGIFCL
jgi:hypothetical protein